MPDPEPQPTEPEGLEARVSLETLITGLRQPGAVAPGEIAEVVQTHISVVFLAGRRAIKVKKPLRLWGFLDYGTVEQRRRMCEAEVRLNQRLAPEVYRGVVPITRDAHGLHVGGDGEVVEHAVEMTRLPKGVTLLERLEAEDLKSEEIERAGRTLASFHAAHRLAASDARRALPSAFARILRRNFESSTEGVPEPFPAAVHDGLHVRMRRRLLTERARIQRRVTEGRMVDGHGDIRLEHVVRQQGRTAIIDCCEFTPLLRHIDPLSDAAFLAMDLVAHGRPDLAHAFERAYLEHGGDPDGAHLLPLYRAYRAHVRAMVDVKACLRPEVDAATKERKALGARRMLALAWTESRTGAAPPVIVLRGAAGVGKSWVATRVAPWLRADILRSDVVRKQLLGLDPTWRPSPGEKDEVYGARMHERTYQELIARARASVRAGRAAILDATYLKRFTRDEVRAMATAEGSPYVVLDVTCDAEVARRRIVERAARGDDASDADVAIYEDMVRTAEPLVGPEAALYATYESGRPAEEAVLPLLAVLEAQLDGRYERLGPEARQRGPSEEA